MRAMLDPAGEGTAAEDTDVNVLRDLLLLQDQQRKRAVQALEERCDDILREKAREIAALESHFKLKLAERSEQSAPADDTDSAEHDSSSTALWKEEFEHMAKANADLNDACERLQRRCKQYEDDAARHRASEESLRSQVLRLEQTLRSKQQEFEGIEERAKQAANTAEEKLLYVQMQLQSSRKAADDDRREYETERSQIREMKTRIEEQRTLLQTRTEMVDAIQQKLQQREDDLLRAREKVARIEKQLETETQQAMEKDSRLQKLADDLQSDRNALQRLQCRLMDLEAYKKQTEPAMDQFASLRESSATWQDQLAETKATIKRSVCASKLAVAFVKHEITTSMLQATSRG
jgi:DNA repair exonuclease SbcCD ATPase subunit